MAVEIPEPFKWDESFKVFYDNLDEEHKGLFDGIFKCAEHRSCNDALSSLKTLVDNHFATEEGMMAAKNYENFEGHKKMHDEFKEKLHSLAVPLDDATIHFAKNWLVNHIKATDFEYKGKL